MKILFFLHKDVNNIPSAKIAKEMMRRNYSITFYANYMDTIHIRMFQELNVEIKPVSQFSLGEIDSCDFIYVACTLTVFPMLMNVHKYIFTFSTVVFDEPGGYADFTFTQRDMEIWFQNSAYSVEKINAAKVCPGKCVGNPKYDVSPQKDISVKKQILFVDAGHFPWGKKGKMEEAKVILKIAESFPEYTVTIKPRFFPEDKSVTHRNAEHLYDCLRELTDANLPKNIYCINKHVDLEEIVRESEAIITPDMTSTYLDIGAYGKKGIIASNIPSEESIIHNEGHMDRFKNIENRSDLCVPYTKILKYLPEGKVFNEQNEVEMGLDKKDVSKNIVDTMERIYNHFIIHDIYPGQTNDFESIEKTMTMSEIISIRYIKALFSLLDNTKCRIEELDFSETENYIFQLLYDGVQINADNYPEYWKTVELKVRNVILSSKDILMHNAMKQSYYLQSLFEAGKIQYEKEDDYSAKEMFWCLKGKYEIITMKNAERALGYFRKFLDSAAQNKHEKTLADSPYYKESATYWSGVCHFMLGNLSEAKQLFEYLEQMTNNNHKKAKEYLNNIEELQTVKVVEEH